MAEELYKILTKNEWSIAQKSGLIEVEIDQKDGFIHLSTARQLPGTLSLYFADYDSLFLLKLNLSQRAEGLVYEAPSASSGRGGLFPHLYSELGIDQIAQVWEIKRGAFMLPEEVILEAEKN
jgi:uncharacterized protein (DUF952 family)